MPKKPSPTQLSAHFIGIGGIGISALSRWFLAQNWLVSGSDLVESEITKSLRKEGVKVIIGHKKANLPHKPSMVIYNSAIKPDNPELLAAKAIGINPLSYAETIGCLTKAYKTIAVAGSHGKSTTTSLTALVLIAGGFDPNVVVGTVSKEFGNKNFHFGKTKWFVLEADEWKASFLNYHPFISVVTNIDKEHLDFYKNLASVKKTFLKFLAKNSENGFFVLNQDNKILNSLRSPITKIAQKKNIKIFWHSAKKNKIAAGKIKKIMKIPGEHNVSNALAAYTVAREILEIKEAVILKSLGSYTGAWRRMEFKGKLEIRNWKLEIFDDYAHHPTEIKATLSAFRQKYSKNKIICVYQPHQAKRLKNLFDEFVAAFNDADILIMTPIYEVAGRDKINSSYTSEKLAAAILKKYPEKQIYYLNNPKNIKSAVTKILPPATSHLSPLIIMMGAGTISEYTKLLLK
jgi:UDP-N-acetylmuramate--alanine ligase